MNRNICEKILSRLTSPEPRKLFLDTDAANEIDDQFAIAYAMCADNIELLGLGAAPFVNNNADNPAQGMEKSYVEMRRVRDLTCPGSKLPLYRGAGAYLKDKTTPVDSPAARAIIEAAHSSDDYVFAAFIGCFTDAASALLIDPSISKNLVIVLIGANDADRYQSANDFNLRQDRAAAQVVFESDCPVILLPAAGGTSVLTTTVGETAYYLEDKNIPVGDYLSYLMRRDHDCPRGSFRPATHIIWDISSVAILRGKNFVSPEIRDALSVDDEGMFIPAEGKYIYNKSFDRDAIFEDMYKAIVKKAYRTE